MFKFKELIENSDELTKIIVAEHGKVYEDARGSLTRGLEVVEYACGIPQMLKGEFTEMLGLMSIVGLSDNLWSLQGLHLLIFLQWFRCDVPYGNSMWKYFCFKAFRKRSLMFDAFGSTFKRSWPTRWSF